MDSILVEDSIKELNKLICQLLERVSSLELSVELLEKRVYFNIED